MSRRRIGLAQPVQPYLLPVYGEEPIGAAQIDALDTAYGAALSGIARPINWGLQGSFETTDQSVWVGPQVFSKNNGSTLPLDQMTDGLPNTTAPAGLPSAAKSLLWGL